MKTFATIKENDEATGANIELSLASFIDEDDRDGFKVVASNGDDVGYFRAQSAEKCESDIRAMWSRWTTYKEN